MITSLPRMRTLHRARAPYHASCFTRQSMGKMQTGLARIACYSTMQPLRQNPNLTISQDNRRCVTN